MAACGSNDGYKNRLYYRCNVARGYEEYERKCTKARYFKAEDVDFTIWEWLKSFIRNPDAVDAGIAEYEEHREQEQAPVRERLVVVDDLLVDHRAQLQKLLDLYLDGNFPKEILVERRQRLQETIDSLVVCCINNARNCLSGLCACGRVAHLPKMGDEACVIANQRNSS